MDKNDEIAIEVSGVNKKFKLPHEKQSSLKGAFLSSFKSKRYETQNALKDINFSVKKGEFFGIVGRNGSGKSTLLKCIAGVYTPNRGSIKINGSLVPFIELGVGFNPELSGRDNIYLNGALIGFSRAQMDKMYDEIVEFAELEDFMDQKLKNYSSGMQVRLAFSIAIRAKSDILLLDEVLAVGDTAFQQKCNNYFEDLKRNKKTVILVTHSMDAVNRYCDRALLIEDGVISKLGSPQQIADDYTRSNINIVNSSNIRNKIKSNSNLKIRVTETTDKVVNFDIINHHKYDFEVYVGFSIIQNGVSFAELNNINNNKNFNKSGKCSYRIDISNYNPGLYELTATLFKLKNRSKIDIVDRRPTFQIKGYDINRGAAIKLPFEGWD
jgi:ABC-type polysaccharide/polyol phosphate transport system ATPase subunit